MKRSKTPKNNFYIINIWHEFSEISVNVLVEFENDFPIKAGGFNVLVNNTTLN